MLPELKVSLELVRSTHSSQERKQTKTESQSLSSSPLCESTPPSGERFAAAPPRPWLAMILEHEVRYHVSWEPLESLQTSPAQKQSRHTPLFSHCCSSTVQVLSQAGREASIYSSQDLKHSTA